MCGIFGMIVNQRSKVSSKRIELILRRIALLSESRGKDSSGIAFRNIKSNNIQVLKGDLSISQLLKSNEFADLLVENLDSYKKNTFTAFGHARLVTNGSQLYEVNNQPVLKNGIIAIHNGIIVNTQDLWIENSDLTREFLIDTEIIPAMFRKELTNHNDLGIACKNVFCKLKGTYSIALMFNDLDQLVIASNNGSLYYISVSEEFFLFASEIYFLLKLIEKLGQNIFRKSTGIQQIQPSHGIIINLSTLKLTHYNSHQNEPIEDKKIVTKLYEIQKQIINNKSLKKEVIIDPSIYINRSQESHLYNLLEFNSTEINKLKRCTKCLLPETFPFIKFNEEGVCNYCLNYKQKNQTNRIAEFKEIVKPFRRKDNRPDCIVPFSGGRDSSFSLHIIKNVLNLNPISYTYDWGMVTDLARRNIARVCGKLGIENIIVSADIRLKRHYIKLNIEAWLKKPTLGMIPLFMSGDKAFHYYLVQLQKQTGISLNIWGANFLEKTDFKVGFAGIPPEFTKENLYSLSPKNSIRLLKFISKSVLDNPRYINSSIPDNLRSQYSRSFLTKSDVYNLYDYYLWDEDTIQNTIISEYDWERAIDTNSTWRIGDGTSAFYNYIYYTVAGFSEIDTFRSNQIREGMLDRDTAWTLIKKENEPRYETIRWYLEIVGVDFEKAIKKINSMDKLYRP
jgi:glutamine---fructose-6-phosphate transaminase (isomerizing)